MWSPELIRQYVMQQLAIMVAAEGLLKDSVSKSLRKYVTEVHPLLKERLEVYGVLTNDTDSLTTTTSYSYYPTDQGFHGSRLMNYVFQSMFDQEEPEWGGHVIYISGSTKTLEETISNGLVMSKMIKEKVLACAGFHGEPASFRAIVGAAMGYGAVADLLDNNILSTSLGRHINNFLSVNKCFFPHTDYLIIAGRTIAQDLTMVTKYYPGRDDFRAYCRDTNWMRHLCGICLHRLLLPADMGLRKNLDREKVIPAKDKDLLDLCLPYPRYNEVALLILGDVSNFTGSLGNSWLMLYCMALQLGQGGTWTKRRNLFSIEGALFAASWYELIVVYLYLTVGYPAYVEESCEYQYLPGGFLGVSANITTGLLFLSVVLENLNMILRRWCRVARAQAGGDDFAFAIIVQSDDRAEATELIREHINRYVGPLKEFAIIDLKERQQGRLGDHTFCKKWIELTFTDNAIQLKGHDNLPIAKALLPNAKLSSGDAMKQWYAYDSTLNKWEDTYGHPKQCDSMRRLYSLIYPSILPLRRRTVKLLLPDGYETREVGDRHVTNKAYSVACTVEDVGIDGLVYLSGLSEKVNHCLKSNRLTLRKVNRYGSLVLLVLCENEVHSLRREEQYDEVGLDADITLTNIALTLVTKP